MINISKGLNSWGISKEMQKNQNIEDVMQVRNVSKNKQTDK